MKTYRILAAAVVVSVVAGLAAAEGDAGGQARWPAWRGPAAMGSADEGSYPTTWSDERNVRWKVALPGKGCSTPAVWDDRIFITAPADGKDAVMAFDHGGREQWRTVIAAAKDGKHRNGSSSNPSPVTDGERVFAYFKSGALAGLDVSGKLLWSTNLQERFGRDTLYWDVGTSPVLTRQHVIVAVMHQGESYLAAFDKATGDLAWKVSRNYDCPVEGDHSYTTPIVVKQGGKEAIIVWGAEHVTSHNAADGKVLWSCGGFNPQRKGNWVAVASHVIIDDLAIVPYGRGSHLAAVKLGGEGDVTATHRPWTRSDTGAFVPTPAAADGRIYLLTDRGQVECIEAKTGKTLWKGDLPKAAASYYASPVVAGGRLYATREDGVIFVAAVKDKLELLAENNMGERVIASPVPVANRLLIRGEKHLFCIEEKK